jgi:multidrug efflux pump subunit AcrA (membrane-fusion protein)
MAVRSWTGIIPLLPLICCCARCCAEEPADPVTSTVTVEECQIRVVNRALLAAEREGVVDRNVVRVGETVEEGAELLLLRSEVPRATLELAEFQAGNDANLRLALALRDSLQSDYESVRELDEQNAISSRELRLRKREYDRAVLTVEQREYEQRFSQLEVARARAELNAYRVRAPFAGTVTRVMKSPGESVQDGEPVLELVNTGIVHVEGYGRLSDFWNVRAGTRVRVQLVAPELEGLEISDEPVEGRLILVDPLVQPVARQVRIVAEAPNPNNILRDGLTARMIVDLTTAPEKNDERQGSVPDE